FNGGVLRVLLGEFLDPLPGFGKILLPKQLANLAQLSLLLQIVQIVNGHFLELQQFRFVGIILEAIRKHGETFFIAESCPKSPCVVQYLAEFLALLAAVALFLYLAQQILRLGIAAVQLKSLTQRCGCFGNRSFSKTLLREAQLLLDFLSADRGRLDLREENLGGLVARIQAEGGFGLVAGFVQFPGLQKIPAAIKMLVQLGKNLAAA